MVSSGCFLMVCFWSLIGVPACRPGRSWLAVAGGCSRGQHAHEGQRGGRRCGTPSELRHTYSLCAHTHAHAHAHQPSRSALRSCRRSRNRTMAVTRHLSSHGIQHWEKESNSRLNQIALHDPGQSLPAANAGLFFFFSFFTCRSRAD